MISLKYVLLSNIPDLSVLLIVTQNLNMHPEMISYLVELWAYDKLRAKIMSLITKSDIFVASGFIEAGNTFLIPKRENKDGGSICTCQKNNTCKEQKSFPLLPFSFCW